ncbi:hypothetical protein RF11_10065 [Thelohanellus kitauei]|uniref:Uncharacterized protein n=1 Tax=Thelohanellus kitauei TaxID=669202 RepID=A0A0C2NBZ3_THEKT|nr:hypothetical protein RF11_10065 [Thelohanellus kitauei]
MRVIGIGFLRNAPILEKQYDTILEDIDIGRLVAVASHGLQSQNEKTFNECHKVLTELFLHPSTSICKKRFETTLIVDRLYNSHVHRIVKDCIEVILTSRNTSNIKGCGDMLRIMKCPERHSIQSGFKIETWVLKEMLENYPEEISSDRSILENLTKIFRCYLF